MGRRGPPKKPVELKLLEGNPGKRALPDDTPKPDPVSRPGSPLRLYGRAKKLWTQLTEQLERIKVLTETDLLALGKYCDLHEQWIQLRKDIRKNGYTAASVNKAGMPYTTLRPEVNLFNKITLQLTRFEREFGLTPAARSSIRVAKPEVNKDKARLYGGY